MRDIHIGGPAGTDQLKPDSRRGTSPHATASPEIGSRPSSEAIAAEGLVKRFGGFAALDGLDLVVRQGEVHGLLGPNGAGKSTTLRVLLGLVRRDAGRVSVLGRDPWEDAVRIHRRLAYVPGDVALWPNLTGGETIDLLLRLRGIDPARTSRDQLVERFLLDPTKKGRAYSKGNRQKVALVAALAAPVDLLVLDEPTSGLDPLMERVFNDCLGEHKAAGATVLLSSHILSEVERLADRVTIIRGGRTVETGSLDGLRQLRRNHVRAEVETPLATDLHGVHDLVHTDSTITCTVDSDGLPELLAALQAAHVRDLTVTPPSLEELFLDAYSGGLDVPQGARP